MLRSGPLRVQIKRLSNCRMRLFIFCLTEDAASSYTLQSILQQHLLKFVYVHILGGCSTLYTEGRGRTCGLAHHHAVAHHSELSMDNTVSR